MLWISEATTTNVVNNQTKTEVQLKKDEEKTLGKRKAEERKTEKS